MEIEQLNQIKEAAPKLCGLECKSCGKSFWQCKAIYAIRKQ